MASAKLATLIIRTLAKPISNRIKEQVRQHETFRTLCVDLAQFMYRSEVKLRTNILGEPARHIRPLSEAKAIENGSNALAEGFLFSVAAALIIGETYRSSRNQSKRRDSVDDQLEDLSARVSELTARVDGLVGRWEDELGSERARNDELARILERVVDIGLRAGWSEFQDKDTNNKDDTSPLQLPRIQFTPQPHVKINDSSLAAVARATGVQDAGAGAGTGEDAGGDAGAETQRGSMSSSRLGSSMDDLTTSSPASSPTPTSSTTSTPKPLSSSPDSSPSPAPTTTSPNGNS